MFDHIYGSVKEEYKNVWIGTKLLDDAGIYTPLAPEIYWNELVHIFVSHRDGPIANWRFQWGDNDNHMFIYKFGNRYRSDATLPASYKHSKCN